MRALWHRFVEGHWPVPWDVFLLTDTPDQGCWRCVKDTVMRDVADSQRPWGKGW